MHRTIRLNKVVLCRSVIVPLKIRGVARATLSVTVDVGSGVRCLSRSNVAYDHHGRFADGIWLFGRGPATAAYAFLVQVRIAVVVTDAFSANFVHGFITPRSAVRLGARQC